MGACSGRTMIGNPVARGDAPEAIWRGPRLSPTRSAPDLACRSPARPAFIQFVYNLSTEWLERAACDACGRPSGTPPSRLELREEGVFRPQVGCACSRPVLHRCAQTCKRRQETVLRSPCWLARSGRRETMARRNGTALDGGVRQGFLRR